MTTLPRDYNGHAMQTFPGNWDDVRRVAIGASSTQSNALNSKLVLIIADVDCYVAVGVNPTATVDQAGSVFLAKGASIEITPSSTTHKIAVIRHPDAADGGLSILPSN